MKKSKKAWGILGTSMGSTLIIVALLTMVGMGSKNTYASPGLCSCSGSASLRGTKCYIGTTYVGDCTCSSGKPDGFGGCADDFKPSSSSTKKDDSSTKVTCKAGTYPDVFGTCRDCEEGKYCPGGTFDVNNREGSMIECPSNSATCTSTGFTCKSGYHKNDANTDCVAFASTTKCDAGSYYSGTGNYCAKCPKGYYCPGGDIDSKVGTPNGIYQCPAGAYCPEGTNMVKTCPEGTTSERGSTQESDCKSTAGSETINCPPGKYYIGKETGYRGCATCTPGYYCPGGSFFAYDSTGAGLEPCGEGETSGSGAISCSASSNDDDPSNPNTPTTGGDDKPNNPTTPSGGNDGSGGNGGGNGGGNSGGNTGGNGNNGNNGGNSGGNNGNNNGSNNVNRNPSTATKAPLVIAIIGIMSVGISTVVYFKGKKEINTEI